MPIRRKSIRPTPSQIIAELRKGIDEQLKRDLYQIEQIQRLEDEVKFLRALVIGMTASRTGSPSVVAKVMGYDVKATDGWRR